jgi:hypothetical protein
MWMKTDGAGDGGVVDRVAGPKDAGAGVGPVAGGHCGAEAELGGEGKAGEDALAVGAGRDDAAAEHGEGGVGGVAGEERVEDLGGLGGAEDREEVSAGDGEDAGGRLERDGVARAGDGVQGGGIQGGGAERVARQQAEAGRVAAGCACFAGYCCCLVPVLKADYAGENEEAEVSAVAAAEYEVANIEIEGS